MLENLRQMNRLSDLEERRIDNKIRIVIIAIAAAVVAFVIWKATHGAQLGPSYYVIMITLLVVIWLAQNVVSTLMKHALAQRTDEQVSAYLKAAALDLVSYAGLAWFLIAMNSNSIFGAIVYVVGVTGARKQRDIYYTEPEEQTGNSSDNNEDASDKDVSAALTSGIPSGSTEDSSVDALPTAQDRYLREKETEDGSV